jgi:hypothetical protein
MGSPAVIDFDAKLDTGADMTLVPTKVRKLLSIPVTSWMHSSGALGNTWRTTVPIFYIRIRVAGGTWTNIKASETQRDYVLLGRDILNQYILTAHGPEGWFELNLPSPAA